MGIIIQEIWSDLHNEIKVDARGSIKKVINIEAVRASINNILLTPKGTRVMLRDFGSDIKALLFENVDENLTDIIAEEIKTAIRIWDNRVIVNSINFTTDPDKNSVSIGLTFTILGYDEVFSFSTVI